MSKQRYCNARLGLFENILLAIESAAHQFGRRLGEKRQRFHAWQPAQYLAQPEVSLSLYQARGCLYDDLPLGSDRRLVHQLLAQVEKLSPLWIVRLRATAQGVVSLCFIMVNMLPESVNSKST